MSLTLPQDSRRHAIVIGSSMAGLVAARVLLPYFERVTLVERDALPAGPEVRRGVPQARHAHVLLVRGQRILNDLFPGLTTELAAAGAPTVDWSADCAMHTAFGWGPRQPSGMITYTCSRPLLEWTVRQRLAAQPQVQFLTGAEATGLETTTDRSRVTGVHLRFRQAPPPELNGATILAAGLVIDASGRTSQLPAWLQALGYDAPRETTINSFLGYASRWYQKPAGFAADWKCLLIAPKPLSNPRSAVIYPIENSEWIVTLGGINRIFPPTDEAGFLEFARQLTTPALHDAIQNAEPLSSIFGYQRTENRWRHYESLVRWPLGLAVLGDAVCAFNPVYGQGITTGALGALALARCLEEQQTRHADVTSIGLPFQRALARVNQTAWLMATGEDFRWPATEGGRPSALTRLLHRYMDQVLQMASHDAFAQRAFMQVSHLVEPPSHLFSPAMMARVIGHVARNGLHAVETAPGGRPV